MLCMKDRIELTSLSYYSLSFFFLRQRRPPRSTLFPYATLFRSLHRNRGPRVGRADHIALAGGAAPRRRHEQRRSARCVSAAPRPPLLPPRGAVAPAARDRGRSQTSARRQDAGGARRSGHRVRRSAPARPPRPDARDAVRDGHPAAGVDARRARAATRCRLGAAAGGGLAACETPAPRLKSLPPLTIFGPPLIPE